MVRNYESWRSVIIELHETSVIIVSDDVLLVDRFPIHIFQTVLEKLLLQ